MKRFFALLTIAAMTVSLVACGKSAEKTDSSDGSQSVTAASTADNTGAEGAQTGQTEYSSFCGMWYNVDTSLAEVILAEGSVTLRGDAYAIVDVVPSEGTNSETNESYTSYTLYSEEIGDGICLEVTLLDEKATGTDYKSMYLYEVNRSEEGSEVSIGYYINDIQYTNGELAAEALETADGAVIDDSMAMAGVPISENARFYLLDSVELSDGSIQSKDEFSSKEFALIYDESSACMNGMMFTDSDAGMFRLGSENGVMQVEVPITDDAGNTEAKWLPISFNGDNNTMSLDFTYSGLPIIKMTFRLAGEEEFFSGNRAILKTMY